MARVGMWSMISMMKKGGNVKAPSLAFCPHVGLVC